MVVLHKGLHANRLAPDQDNPREVAFFEQWLKDNEESHFLSELLKKYDWIPGIHWDVTVEQLAPYDQQSASVAATVIQWLGSNVGFSFLQEALNRCGFKIVRK